VSERGTLGVGVVAMTNQHTSNHNASFTFPAALQQNHIYEAVVQNRNREFDNVSITPIPWKQIHRANIPHLARRSPG